MRIAPKPDRSVPIVDGNGNITQEWDDYFRALSLGQLFDVSKTAPTNNQVLIYNATTGKWTPGAN